MHNVLRLDKKSVYDRSMLPVLRLDKKNQDFSMLRLDKKDQFSNMLRLD